jgi:pyruvyl transferase EpsO
MPDMAHQLWGRPAFAASSSKQEGTLLLRRRDKESRDFGTGKITHFDWDDLNGSASNFLLRCLRKWQIIDNPLRHWISNYELWRLYRDWLIRRAGNRFRPFLVIDTDRLHGMILGALMSKKVIYGEGTYGKLHRYAQLWLAGSDLIERENSGDIPVQ